MTHSPEVIEVADGRPAQVDATAGRAAAFVRLADDHLDASYRLARAILRDPGEAEDATHDAMLQAWNKWSTLRDQSLFAPWFDRILINICRNRLKRASRWQASDISSQVAVASGDAYRQADDRDLLERAVATLRPDHQVVVALRFYRDLQVEQIAIHLGIPAGTVRSRLHYALKQLHRLIDPADAKGTSR